MSDKHAKRKPWKEAHQTALTCSVFVALVAIAIYVLGTYVPMAPLTDKPRASMQEVRR